MNWKDLSLRTLLSTGLAALLLFVASPSLRPVLAAQGAPAGAQAQPGGEANLVIPDLGAVSFLGIPGDTLLMMGL
ncbi:MAG TPA: hypothetical protein VFZ21_22260, partial [Gemmatimonadaceae bacterium]|nr:hypothetical protein [Gemmatimonadaceae bacterium]